MDLHSQLFPDATPVTLLAMSDSALIDERFVFLETKVAYQEHTIAELNDAILHQSRTIDDLTLRLTRVEGQLNSLGTGQATPNERPPHY